MSAVESSLNGKPGPVFKFKDRSTLEIEQNLSKLATNVAEKLKAGKNEISLPERFVGEIFNLFTTKFFPKYAKELEKYEEAVDKEDWWMEFIADNLDLIEPAKGLYQDDLIRVGNAAADLGFSGVVHACAYVMAEQTENMKLKDLREYLNEEYDFPPESKAKIEACPEYAEL